MPIWLRRYTYNEILNAKNAESDAVEKSSKGKGKGNIDMNSPNKSKISVIQSIGRGLRKTDTKFECNLYDIADDLSWKSKKNYSMLHFLERMKIYNNEKFDYKIFNVNL